MRGAAGSLNHLGEAQMKVYSLRVLSMLAVGFLGLPHEAWGQSADADLRRIMSDWERREKTICTLRFKVNGTVTIPKGRYTGDPDLPADVKGDVPSADHQFPITIDMLMDFANHRFQKEVDHEIFHCNLAKFVRKVEVNTFDGQSFSYFTPLDSFNDPLNKPGKRTGVWQNVERGGKAPPENFKVPYFGYWEFPMLFARGTFTTNPDPRNLEKRVGPQFHVHGYAEKDSRRCVVLRTSPLPSGRGEFDEVWVDLERTGSITRWIHYISGRGSIYTNIITEKRNEGWMPKEWSTSYYRGKKDRGGIAINKLESSFHLSVSDLIVNAVLTTQDPETKPDMIIWDHDKGGRLYQVEPDGSLAPLDIGPDGQIRKGSNWTGWRGWTGMILLIIFAVLCIVFVLSWNRTKSRFFNRISTMK